MADKRSIWNKEQEYYSFQTINGQLIRMICKYKKKSGTNSLQYTQDAVVVALVRGVIRK
ncbi:uncharacterized protein LOC143022953 isoform X3 [Oratosquilla oratoria]|uniref:uncharacterized protein LOC143022953 isoform X3 n=1 Tax=Oratosquilla oratoria TaxID=337810 RepID=UPI003F75F3B1